MKPLKSQQIVVEMRREMSMKLVAEPTSRVPNRTPKPTNQIPNKLDHLDRPFDERERHSSPTWKPKRDFDERLKLKPSALEKKSKFAASLRKSGYVKKLRSVNVLSVCVSSESKHNRKLKLANAPKGYDSNKLEPNSGAWSESKQYKNARLANA
jgi:hypothetical protein